MAEAFETFVPFATGLLITWQFFLCWASTKPNNKKKHQHKCIESFFFPSCRQFKFVSQTTPNFASLKGTQNKRQKRMENNLFNFSFSLVAFSRFCVFIFILELTHSRMEMLINSID